MTGLFVMPQQPTNISTLPLRLFIAQTTNTRMLTRPFRRGKIYPLAKPRRFPETCGV
jgi:hypothetical protein